MRQSLTSRQRQNGADLMSTDAKQALDDHARSIDSLHQKLASMPGTDTARLNDAFGKYKAAHKQFEDDALGCMN